MSEVNMELAKAMYESVCTTLDNMKLNYKKAEEDLVIMFSHRGDDMEHNLIMAVNAEKEAIQLFEKLPFAINQDKAVDVCVAMAIVNDMLLSGKFTYNMKDRLSYEVTQIYSGSLIGEETIKRMILALVFTVEEYDDKFLALNKGYLKATDFIESK